MFVLFAVFGDQANYGIVEIRMNRRDLVARERPGRGRPDEQIDAVPLGIVRRLVFFVQ